MPGPFNRFQPNNNVPIIGQPFKVFECVPLVTIQCNCQPTNNPIIINGIDVLKKCQHCGKIFGITAVQYDRRTNGPVLFTVSLVNVSQSKPEELETESELEAES